MASKQMLAILAVIVVALPSVATATEFIVGDDNGWSLKVNYTEWAAGKEFKVGDTLVFKYGPKKHNVLKIGGDGFGSCDTTKALATLDSGNDVVPLASPGKKWYICGKPGHCEAGMKLVINVVGDNGMAPSMAPSAPVPVSAVPVAGRLSAKVAVVVAAAAGAVFF